MLRVLAAALAEQVTNRKKSLRHAAVLAERVTNNEVHCAAMKNMVCGRNF